MRSVTQKLFSILLWVILIGLIGYEAYYYYESRPCINPIEYSIGSIDPRFNVSTTTFKDDLAKAGALWSKAAGKTLFEYNPNGDVTINLVFDNRQKITDQEQTLNSSIDATNQVAQSVKDQYESLKTSYNNSVEYWNSKGGAPQDERTNVNTLADQINALIDKYNLLVAHINDNVSAINNDGLSGTQFEEGVYITDSTGKSINIYQFDNQTTFLRVLAHEMGHSLGLEHNNGAQSIMNPVNQGTSVALSPEDIAALKALCKV
jgi:predicted Zn-dependent protease